MKKTMFLSYAPPCGANDKQATLADNSRQFVKLNLKNCVNLDGIPHNDKAVKKNASIAVLGVHKKIEFPENAQFNLFNVIANPEDAVCQQYLSVVKKLTTYPQVQRVFNHPGAIVKTSRLHAQYLFAGIDGVIIPKIKKVPCTDKQQLADEIANRQIPLPAILREIGVHNGEGMHLINSADDIKRLDDSIFELKTDKLFIEYLSKPDSNGMYHKCRLAFVDGQCFPRHKIFSDHWCVHARDRARLMLNDESLRAEEHAFLNGFTQSLSDRQKHALNEMNKRIGLDIWGMDFAVNEKGEFVVFEANACMNFFGQNRGPNKEFDYLLPFQSAIRRAIKKLIVQN